VSEHTEKVPAILLDEFDRREEMRQGGIVVASVSERGGWFGVELRFRAFGGQVPEIGSFPAIKEEEVTDDKIRELISEGLRVIWELYQQKAAEQ